MDAYMLISFLLLLLQFTLCFSKDTITMNHAFKEGDLLVSTKSKFALGFFSPGNSSYRYLGIWFHKIPEPTVVWVANRNHPIIGSSGILSIDRQGNLLLHSNKNLVWSTNVSVQINSTLTVQLLDSGNLVLLQGKIKIWQSFDHPTNTILPGMKLGLNRETGLNKFLASWRSADDPATGNYLLRLNPNGSPQFFIYHGARVHWRSSPWPWKRYSQPQQFNDSFDDNGNEIYLRFFFQDDSILGGLVLDDSGLLKWLVWHESDKQWKEFWSTHKDQCDQYRKCGVNSNCAHTILNFFECACLPGYEPKHPRKWQMRDGSGGCIRKRLENSSVCGHGEGFMKVDKVKLPDTSAAIWANTSMSHVECEEECKRNCSCTAYASIPIPEKGNGCLAWYGELIDTRHFSGGSGYDLYVRVDAIELAENAKSSSSFLEMKRMVILSVISAWFFIFVFLLIWIRITKKKRSRKKMKSKLNKKLFDGDALAAVSELEGGSSNRRDSVHFNYRTILAATDNFSSGNKIGQGGFGTVYKGRLSNGQEIAVKRMLKSSSQGIQEFQNEVVLISKLQHKNLVKLLGCCIKRKEQILIYEYLPNKSLDSFLFDERRSLLNWRKRVNIIAGIAHGMLYLHQESRLTIIHRDLKSSNILLDAEMNPKISDFGMAKIFRSDQIQGRTKRVVGTYGYMSPEYAVLGKFSAKSDVFSFGVIVLEVLSGKKCNGFTQGDSSLTLIGKVWELWNDGRALEMIDSALRDSYSCEEALRCIQVGLLCVQEDAMDRPPMLQVILMLESDVPLSSPKQPAFIFRTSCYTKLPNEETYSVNELTISDVLTR